MWVSILEEELAAIGFGAVAPGEAGDWRVERLGDGPSDISDSDEPALDPDLSIFSDLLREPHGPPIYRIRRIK
jgi:hypothetical protein